MRFSLCGGGSDLPEFLAHENFGQTLTTTINKHVYVALHASSNEKYRFVYSEIEECEDIRKIKHRILRELFSYQNTSENIELFSIADLPAKGTGLGASSAFCLAAVAAVSEYNQIKKNNLEYAKIASYIEMDLAGSSAGFQDQYASATGGITLLEFSSAGLTQATPIDKHLPEDNGLMQWLDDHFVFVRSPGSRDSSQILKEIKFSDSKIRNLQKEIRDLVPSAISAILDRDINTLGSIIDKNWTMKKELSPASSNETIDGLYAKGLNYGALGGKLLGAGGSGYVVFAVESRLNFLNKMGLSDTEIHITGEKLEVQEI
jgi:D-glycero-alpha-D-manno-heptose-7-phosphate kinase